MEFQYRAIDERRSRSPPPPVVPSTPGSGSADSHGGGGPAELVGNSAVTLWQPDLPPPKTVAVGADELRRQAQKARIRERILREEAEHWELELEVRSELREQMLRLSWPVLGRSVSGSDTPAALSVGTMTAANSLLPVVALEIHSKANALATAPTKRKSPDRATGALLLPSSKKQNSALKCMACDITANSEKVMQDHLNGKVHKRKVVALPELPNVVPEIEQERGFEPGEEEAVAMETLGDYKPTKFMMATTAGDLNEVTQMDGYLLCELCNVRTSDRVTMMCHLQGSKHISNGQKKCQSGKPLGAAKGTVSAATSAIDNADPKKLVLEDFSVPLPHTVRLLEGFLVCELCDVKVPSTNGMRQHLSGKKHKNKANTKSDASAEFGDDDELQEMTVAPPNEDDSAKTARTEMMKNSAISDGAQFNYVSDSDSLTMEVDSVMHPLSRVDGFLVCLRCDAKAPSETIMRSHLAGKKHKRKMTLDGRGNNDLSVSATGATKVQDNNSKSMKANVEAGSVPQAKTAVDNTAAMAPMAVDRPAEAQVDTCIVEPAEDGEISEEAEGEHAAASSNGSVAQTKESVRANDTTPPGKPIKIQVEGKVFTVTTQ